jgi:hypothetical protein
MTSVLDEPELEFEPEPDAPVVLLDEHAPTPAARRAAAVTAASLLGPINLEFILVFPVVERSRPPISAMAG